MEGEWGRRKRRSSYNVNCPLQGTRTSVSRLNLAFFFFSNMQGGRRRRATCGLTREINRTRRPKGSKRERKCRWQRQRRMVRCRSRCTVAPSVKVFRSTRGTFPITSTPGSVRRVNRAIFVRDPHRRGANARNRRCHCQREGPNKRGPRERNRRSPHRPSTGTPVTRRIPRAFEQRYAGPPRERANRGRRNDRWVVRRIEDV